MQETIFIDNRTVSPPALRCLENGIKAFSVAERVLRVRVMKSLDRALEAMDILTSSATKKYNSLVDLENSPHQPFTQEGLVVYADDIQSTRKTSWAMGGKEWDLKRLTRLMTTLKRCVLLPRFLSNHFVYRSKFSRFDFIHIHLITGQISMPFLPFRSESASSRSSILRFC